MRLSALVVVLIAAWAAPAAAAPPGWHVEGDLAKARSGHTATLLPSGRVLVAGGRSGPPDGYTGTSEVFDPVRGTWSSGPGLSGARAHHTATLLLNGKVLVAGGDTWQTFASTEIYDPGDRLVPRPTDEPGAHGAYRSGSSTGTSR